MKSVVLFHCCDAHTPLPRLRARRRWADWTITTRLASTVAMVESIAAIVILGASPFEIILGLAATNVCLLTAIPAILLMPVVSECERELRARGALPVEYRPVEKRLPRYVGRMCFFFALTVVANAAFS